MKAKRRLTIAGIVLGAFLMVSPLIGLLGTVLGMSGAFEALGNTGIKDPHALSENIGVVLMTTTVGFILLPVGIIIFTVLLIIYLRLRASTPPPLPPTPGQ